MTDKAVFLDRDGTINNVHGKYYVYNKDEFDINPGVTEFLSKIKKAGYLLILISNQSGISKGKYTKEQADKVHKYMQSKLEKENAKFDAIYYCPHHPDIEACLCRKPEPLMIQKAIARFGLDPKKCLMIGDAERDIESAEKADITNTIKIKQNENLMPYLDRIIK